MFVTKLRFNIGKYKVQTSSFLCNVIWPTYMRVHSMINFNLFSDNGLQQDNNESKGKNKTNCIC